MKPAGRTRPRGGALSPRNISAVYVLAGLVVLFSVWIPETFLTTTTLKSVLTEQAVTGIVAVGLVAPLAAGVFDLAVGVTLGSAAITAAWLMGEQGMPAGAAITLALAVGLAVGSLNGALVARVGIPSLIATLGVGSCLQAYIFWISDGQEVIGLSDSFQRLATGELLGVSYPFYFLLALAVLLWYVLEQTPLGRRIYATGGGREAARLSGVATGRLIFLALVVSSVFAATAGVIATARVGAASPEMGPSYLLPAFSAVFLGATQIKNGRFNVWGTVLAVYVLAIGVKGLQLAGAPYWVPDLVNGVALLLAVGLSVDRRRMVGRSETP